MSILKELHLMIKNHVISHDCILLLNKPKVLDVIENMLTKMIVENIEFEDIYVEIFSNPNKELMNMMSEERIKQTTYRSTLEIHNHLIQLEKLIGNLDDKLDNVSSNLEERIEKSESTMQDSFLRILSKLTPKIFDDSMKKFMSR